tara:strand:+ start:158 stop:385 length:228 start_codon:yes stop_codon:yes gene_type:complete
MVLGFVLYETVDVGYNLLKMTYNSVAYTYNWYYGITPETLENKLKHDEDELKRTKERIAVLERRLLALEDSKKNI